jgi:ubiquinone/menaquinone biosynthesis C-methylase UbiE
VDVWSSGASYESYVGRWSRPVAAEFVAWLDRLPHARWLDAGCGTGALTEAVLSAASPTLVVGLDPSASFVAHAAAHVPDPRASFAVADARALPVTDGWFDVAVCGLVLNFVPERTQALTELRRAVGPGGTVAAYVWDYAGGMELMRCFWDAAEEVDPQVGSQRESALFGFCRPEPLRAMFSAAGLEDVDVREIVVPTVFRDFDDYWAPFLRGTGPAPAYAASLDDDGRTALRETVRTRLPTAPDGSIPLTARAWAVRGSWR